MKKKQMKKTKGGRPPRARRPSLQGAWGGRARRTMPRARHTLAVLPRAPEEVGRFVGTRRGFGFVEREGGADIFVPASRMRGALDGDTVRVAVLRDGDRPEGEIVEIVARERTTVIGTVVRDRELGLRPVGEIYLLPDNPHLPVFELPPRGRARVGDKIEVRLSESGENVSFLRSFGKAASRAANYAAILAECEIPTEFSGEALREAERAAAEPLSEEGRRRVHDTVLTIDSAGAKDLDDAISIRRSGDGYILSVHIADVSHYVRPFSALDATAHERGTSVYFADRVVPMLPEALSNGACSLNAGEDKYALTAEMTLAADGRTTKTKLYKSIINSRMRGVYSEVNDLFEHGKASEFYGKYREVYGALEKMRELYLILAERDRRRGILELETAEPIITLGEDGEPTDIRAAERGEAEKLIEAFMLTANRAVAELLHERGIPCVYRVHEAPPPEKYDSLCDYLTSLALPLPWKPGEGGSAGALRHLIEKAAERGLGVPVSMTVLRSMAKARYSAAPEPHFGLALELYCHFTSPIRRLSDLVTHRILKAALLDGAPPQKHRASARRGADAATNGELRALTAERRIEALYKTLYMKRHLGEEFEGRVSSVTPHGFYVELPNTCEGLVPLSLLEGDYVFDEHRRTLTRGNTVFSIGDPVTVTVHDAEVTTGKITFTLAGKNCA